jgi:hypothetical protein
MITSSEILEVSPQQDGRVYITELHTHSDGREETRIYMDDADSDLSALLAAHAGEINDRESVGE